MLAVFPEARMNILDGDIPLSNKSYHNKLLNYFHSAKNDTKLIYNNFCDL